jgi:3,4-dihydroxy-9,10-secoandrosta-1,3,5(10)-triene-9,17-dione 4,5-dioxygenase
MPAEGPRPDGRYFRVDDRPYRLVLLPGSQRQVDAIGLEVGDDLELAEIVNRLRSNGVRVMDGSPEAAAERLVSGFCSFKDPSGLPIETFYGPVLNHVPVQTPLVSRFVTSDMGMGHVVLAVDKPDETVRMFRELLGFSLRNTGHLNVAGRAERTLISFLGCNSRHHTVGVVGMDIPGNIVHLMLETGTIDDVGRALDRCMDAGVPLAMTLGKHTNDHMVSFYAVSPDKLQVEFGWGGHRVEQPCDASIYEITKVSFWGHRRSAPA